MPILRSPGAACALFCCLLWQVSPVSAQQRRAWTSSHVTGTPDPPAPYAIERIFPDQTFREATDFALEPGTGDWFILQQDGKIHAVNPESGQSRLVMDPATAKMPVHQAYGITFHPDYEQNRELYFAYAAVAEGEGRHVSRLRASPESPARIDPASEEKLLTWFALDHNGGNMQFGPDGMLYITAGDSAHPFPPDEFNTAQNLADLRGSILRIDVNRPSGDLPYSIPADNPFVDVPGARGEIWALGLRNPWKISFDQQTGQLWCADVGWEMWEMLYLIERGGNYGWPIREGRQPIRSDVKQGPGEILPPLVDHPHSEARSITGGYVYSGTKLPELSGAYIYGDWSTGLIWAVWQTEGKVTRLEKLVDTPLAIIAFGLDAQGELVILDYRGGLYRLIPNSHSGTDQPFPTKLSETGLFADVRAQQPAAGVIPYQVNAGQFLDGAIAERFLAIPDQASVSLPFFRYPQDTVFVRTWSMPVEQPGKSPFRLETQLLHYDGSEWRGYSYLWDHEQSDAELVGPEGGQREFQLPSDNADVARSLTWNVDSRANCMICHGWIIGHVIGFTFPNLDRRYDPPIFEKALQAAGVSPVEGIAERNQLELLKEWVVFKGDIFPQQHPGTMADPTDESADLTARARAYLAINCAHCHRREGGGAARIELPWENPLEKIRAVDEPAMFGTFGIPGGRVIASGQPYQSILYYRLATVGRGHMPHLGTRNVDEAGLKLIRDWIASLPCSEPKVLHPDALLPADVATVASLSDTERTRIFAETSAALRLSDRLTELTNGKLRREIAAALAEQSPPHLRGLFERHLPAADRVETLGTSIDPRVILALPGSPQNGRELFRNATGLSCRNCHRAEGHGREVGPELTQIGSLRTPEQILESILDPSRQIDPKYVTYAIQTEDGRILTGLLASQDDQRVVLIDSQGETISLATSEIEALLPQPRSLMPELLVRDLTAQELADLLAYLTNLKAAPGE